MKKPLLSKRLTRGVVVGLIGVLVLSVSVFAAYGNSSGYGKYKTAITNLITEHSNFSIDMDQKIICDGKTMYSAKTTNLRDGKNGSEHSTEVFPNGEKDEYFYSVVDGKAVDFYSDSHFYNVYDNTDYYARWDLGENSDKVVKFASILADTVVGDLKNNVVLVSEKDGVSTYELKVEPNQLPALISSGLDLLTAVNGDPGNFNIYEDNEATFTAYYEKVKGEPLPEGYFDRIYNDDSEDGTAETKEYYELWEQMDQSYMDIAEDKEWIIYVHADGTYDCFENESELAQAGCDYYCTNFPSYLGANAVFNHLEFRFSLDDKDRIVDNEMILVFDSTDKKGKAHTLEWDLSMKISDYGTTVVKAFDPGDRVKSEE